MKKAGILFSETDVTTSDIEYDSRKQKMTVDMDPTLKQIQVLPMTGGTVITDTGSGGGYSKLLCNEVLFRVQHNMPFIPKVESYYYVTKADNPPAAPSPINGTVVGSYYKTALPIIFNAMGYGDEQIFTEVDAVYITVRHQVYSWDQTTTFYGVGSYCAFNFRYMVTNLPAITNPSV